MSLFSLAERVSIRAISSFVSQIRNFGFMDLRYLGTGVVSAFFHEVDL